MALYYNSHYTQSADMLGKPDYSNIFQFMLDELASNPSDIDVVSVSLASLSRKRHMARNTVIKIVDHLIEIGLLANASNGSCKNKFMIQLGRYVSLMSAFLQLKDDTDKQNFTDALLQNDYATLDKMGYVYLEDGREQYYGMKSRFLPKVIKNEQFTENCSKMNTFDENVQNCTESSKVFKNEHFIEKCSKMSKKSENAQFWAILLDEYAQNVAKNAQNYTASEYMAMEIEQKCSILINSTELDGLFDDPIAFFEQFPATQMFILGILHANLLYQKCSFLKSNCSFLNIFEAQYNNNINKKKFGIEDSSKESSSLSKTSFEQDEEIDDEEWEPIKFFQTKVKKKKEYPHFQESEVREWLDHPELCVNDDYKLFLYNLILEIEPRYHVEEERDEEGNIIKEESYDDTPIVEQSTLQEILKSALEFTEEAIQDKQLKLDYEDGEQILPVNIDTFDSDRLLSLLDWEGVNTGANDKELRYQVDWSKINIIDQELIPVIDKTNRTTRRSAESIDQVDDERTLDKEYEKQLFNCENTSQLSPIESIVSTILREYFQQDETGDIVLINHGAFIPRDVLKGYTLQYRESGITLQDIAKVTRRCKLDDHENLSTRAQRMFSALQIQYWNNKHGYQSLIS